MTLNKKILATAIVGGLFATAAQAQVVLNTNGSSGTTALRLGNEINLPATVNFGGVADDLRANIGLNFSDGDVKHVRLECSPNVRITAATATLSGNVRQIDSTTPPAATTFPAIAAADFSVGAVNGLNSNAIFFSITDASGNSTATVTRNLSASTVTAQGTFVDIVPAIEIRERGTVSCTYALYDESSQASQGGTTGRIATTVRSGNYATFGASIGYNNSPGEAIATVNANPIYTAFAPSALGNASTGYLGEILFGDILGVSLASAGRTTETGVLITPATLAGSATTHVVEGDMSALANADGTYTGSALGRIYIDVDGTCADAFDAASAVTPIALTATSATFGGPLVASSNVQGALCFQPRTGVPIPASAYTIRYAPQALNASVNPAAISATDAGLISRDGTQLQAPFVQLPPGWISRMVLTNTGTVARPYSIAVLSETGNTISTNAANLTGNIPAGGTTVVDLNTVLTGFTGAARGTLNVSIAAPGNQVQGLYQIVNGQTGSISNHVMVRPNSN